MSNLETKYGIFDKKQIEEYKDKLHKKLFWLLVYKDPKTCKKYENVNFKKYFTFLMKEIDGLNEVLLYPEVIVELMSLLEAAFIETESLNFNYAAYRKLILDAHSLVDLLDKRGDIDEHQ